MTATAAGTVCVVCLQARAHKKQTGTHACVRADVVFRCSVHTPVPCLQGVVMEYVPGTNLQQYLEAAGGKLPEDVARFIFQQLIIAVDFCGLHNWHVNQDARTQSHIQSHQSFCKTALRSVMAMLSAYNTACLLACHAAAVQNTLCRF